MEVNALCRCIIALTVLAVLPLSGAERTELEKVNEAGLAAHRQRSLNEASRHYGQLLTLDPPAEPDAKQMELVRKFAPRLHTVPGEFFPLKDIVAVLHPERPVITYRLFWDDDIAFPADNDPCDHEVVWIEYDPASEEVTRVHGYFHGRILSPVDAVADARAHGGRAWIGVEWGFHGSVPFGALEQARPKLQEHWERAHRGWVGKASPLARGWPEQFAGGFDEFTAFTVSEDPLPLLKERRLVWVSRWPMAVLNRYALRYNVAAKTEWPWPAAEE